MKEYPVCSHERARIRSSADSQHLMVWCILSVTGRFDWTVQADLRNGVLDQDRLGDSARVFLTSFKGWKRIVPPEIDRPRANHLVARATCEF